MLCSVRGLPCRIVEVHAAGTITVSSIDGRRHFNVSGLGFTGDNSPRTLITAARDALFRQCHTGRMSQAKFHRLNLRTACVSAMRDLCGVTLPEVTP